MSKNNLVIVILLLVFIGILFLLDLPTYNKVAFSRNEVKTYENLLEERKGILAKVDQLKQVYEDRKDEINKISYLLPSGKDLPGLIVQFEALTSENGLVLEKLDFSEDSKDDVSLSVSGTYQSFKSFLRALELNIRLMDIKSINFSPSEDGGLMFNFNIKLKVYYQ